MENDSNDVNGEIEEMPNQEESPFGRKSYVQRRNSLTYKDSMATQRRNSSSVEENHVVADSQSNSQGVNQASKNMILAVTGEF